MFKKLKNKIICRFSKHRCSLESLKNISDDEFDPKRVRAVCDRCGETLYANYGLNMKTVFFRKKKLQSQYNEEEK